MHTHQNFCTRRLQKIRGNIGRPVYPFSVTGTQCSTSAYQWYYQVLGCILLYEIILVVVVSLPPLSEMGSAGEWCLIESDPGVFTELIKDFGVKGLQVEELFSLDSESFEHLKPIYGLIFLFKCVSDDSVEGTIVQDNRLDKIFFAKQVINNACATQAIISILLNMNERCLELGETLQEFKAFTSSFDSAMKGLSLSNSKIIRQVHNSFSRQQVFEYDDKFQKSDESYHFIGYLPIDGRLYELDGLKPGPIDHGPIEKNDWLETVRSAILFLLRYNFILA